MPFVVRQATARILILALTIISGMGEWLHWIPGCGHGIQIGSAVVRLGIDVPGTLETANSWFRVACPSGRDIPIYDEDCCAICSAVGQSCVSSDSAPAILPIPLIQKLATVVARIPRETALGPSQARAPPLA